MVGCIVLNFLILKILVYLSQTSNLNLSCSKIKMQSNKLAKVALKINKKIKFKIVA